MKLVLLAAAAALVSTSALARPNTTNMTCTEAQSLVREAGSIVLSTGPNTYERYSTHGERVAYVPTMDDNYCFIGYVRSSDRNAGPHYPGKNYGRTCRNNGETQWLSGPDRDNPLAPLVTRTCVNGTWVVKGTTKPVYRGCKEGSRSALRTGRYIGDHEEIIPAVCVNGKYVPAP